MAKRAGLGLSTLQKIEQGKYPMTEGVAKKLAYAYPMASPEWLRFGSTLTPIVGLSGRVWSKAEVLQFRTRSDETAALEAEASARKLRKEFEGLIKKSLKNEHCWQVIVDAEMAVKDIIRKYYGGKQSSPRPRRKA
jgi:hypothetical protein